MISSSLPNNSSVASKGTTKRKIFNSKTTNWVLWDAGTAAFNSVVTTFVFTVYLTKDNVFTSTETANQYLSMGMAIAGIIIAAFAPIAGQYADRRGRGHIWLAWSTLGVLICMALMFFVYPNSPLGPIGALCLGVGLLGLGHVFNEFATVNYNAMLNHISDSKTIGRVSGIGWAAGYFGGIVLLLILFVGFINPEIGWFGVTHANGLNIRAAVLFATAWFALLAIPVVLNPPLPKEFHDEGKETLLQAYKNLWKTVKSLAQKAPHTLLFLMASAIFRDGLAAVFTFGAILASSLFGFSSSQVIIFGIVANVVAGIATVFFGALDDFIGPKKVIIISLVSMIFASLVIFFFHPSNPEQDPRQLIFWIFGLMLCIFVGPTQSASRSFLGRIIPKGREGEIFGLYSTTGRAVSFLAPAMYGFAIWLGKTITGKDATHWGILGICLVLLAGLLMMIPVVSDKAKIHH